MFAFDHLPCLFPAPVITGASLVTSTREKLEQAFTPWIIFDPPLDALHQIHVSLVLRTSHKTAVLCTSVIFQRDIIKFYLFLEVSVVPRL